ncbi:hypothetical protein [Psychrobacter sp. WY6]|uniref:hypothetical protein n=1 Tax=Psychrobacter sp. WY6 TaxID=2708350 RepID=UPI002022C51E|nr:hypothetical protein [Psychrobacter sp. WY6]
MNELENDLTTVESSAESKPKLAFIDDEQRILRSMKLLFRKTHDVFITTDPTEYIDYIKTTMYTWRSVTSGCLSELVWISYVK